MPSPLKTDRGWACCSVPAPVLGPFGLVADTDAVASAGAAEKGVQVFHTQPRLRPPVVTVTRHAPAGGADDYLFLAPSSGPGQRGVLILDNTGDVVWFHPTTPHTAMNFRTAALPGQAGADLVGGQGRPTGSARGEHVIVDASYREVARFPAGGGRQSDLHEFLITPQGTALVTSYEVRPMDLSAVGGEPNGKVIGGIVQELELPSGRVLFEWRSLDHVAVEESHADVTGHPLDYFHVNSIDVDGDGDLLVSARNTWARLQDRAARPARCSGGSAASGATSRWGRAPCSRGSTTRATTDGGG